MEPLHLNKPLSAEDLKIFLFLFKDVLESYNHCIQLTFILAKQGLCHHLLLSSPSQPLHLVQVPGVIFMGTGYHIKTWRERQNTILRLQIQIEIQ